MITLEQIQELDQKVQMAVNRISTLKSENSGLKTKLDEYQKRIGELEVLIERFKQDQSAIENGIIHALEQLDHLEDSIDDSSEEPTTDGTSKVPQSEPLEVDEEATDDASPEQDENELDIF